KLIAAVRQSGGVHRDRITEMNLRGICGGRLAGAGTTVQHAISPSRDHRAGGSIAVTPPLVPVSVVFVFAFVFAKCRGRGRVEPGASGKARPVVVAVTGWRRR